MGPPQSNAANITVLFGTEPCSHGGKGMLPGTVPTAKDLVRAPRASALQWLGSCWIRGNEMFGRPGAARLV